MSVKFISYTSLPYALCQGLLILEIEGRVIKFGYDGKHHYAPRFWFSGGHIECDDWGMSPISAPWIIDAEALPEKYRPYAEEIGKVFNENVEWGCCGGCI